MEIAQRDKDEAARLWVSELTEVATAIVKMNVEVANKDGAGEIGHLEPLSAVVRERLDDIARQTN